MKSISIILSAFSVVMCLVLVYFLLFSELLNERLVGTNRNILVGVLFTYAAFRLYRIYKSLKTKENER